MTRALILAASVLLASGAMAEVRVVQRAGVSALDVRPIGHAVWSAHAGRGSGVGDLLNPEGDQLGDGYPGHAANSGLIVSWTRAAAQVVVVRVNEAGTVVHQVVLDAPGAVGTPVVAPLNEGWLLLWQSFDPAPRVMASIVRPGAEPSPPVAFLSGRLLGIHVASDAIYAPVADLEAREILIARLARGYPHPTPIPDLALVAVLPRAAIGAGTSVMPCTATDASELWIAWRYDQQFVSTIHLENGEIEGPRLQRIAGSSCGAILKRLPD